MIEKPQYIPSAIVNPYGYAMSFCLNCMNDSLANNNLDTYNKWLNMGLKYAHAFLKADNPIEKWFNDNKNYITLENYKITAI